jgi:hypothetical protein
MQLCSELEWKRYKKSCKNQKWVYLISWTKDIFSWGTTSGSNDRIRKSSLFNPKLTGKYDRRVDYLMLNIIYGMPAVYVFEMAADPTIVESEVRTRIGKQRFCYHGFKGQNRDDISKEILEEFYRTEHYKKLSDEDRSNFTEYLEDVYFAKRELAPNRTFAWGDSLEPNFLKKIDKKHLEPSIGRTLKVVF